MSIENHPNINAAGLTADIMESFWRNLRGTAGNEPKKAVKLVTDKIASFVSNLSSTLDDEFKYTKCDDLLPGEFAIVDHGRDRMAIVGVTPHSFTPVGKRAAVVHIANGIGSFNKETKCVKCTSGEAFRVALEYTGGK